MLSGTWLNYWGFSHINSRLLICDLLGGVVCFFFGWGQGGTGAAVWSYWKKQWSERFRFFCTLVNVDRLTAANQEHSQLLWAPFAPCLLFVSLAFSLLLLLVVFLPLLSAFPLPSSKSSSVFSKPITCSNCAALSPVLSHFVLVWLSAGSKGLWAFLVLLAPVLQTGPSNADEFLFASMVF